MISKDDGSDDFQNLLELSSIWDDESDDEED